jgi:hypothetical protein
VCREGPPRRGRRDSGTPRGRWDGEKAAGRRGFGGSEERRRQEEAGASRAPGWGTGPGGLEKRRTAPAPENRRRGGSGSWAPGGWPRCGRSTTLRGQRGRPAAVQAGWGWAAAQVCWAAAIAVGTANATRAVRVMTRAARLIWPPGGVGALPPATLPHIHGYEKSFGAVGTRQLRHARTGNLHWLPCGRQNECDGGHSRAGLACARGRQPNTRRRSEQPWPSR